MLKRVSNRGGEWGLWLSRLFPSRHRPPPGLFYFFFVGGASCADGSAPTGAGSPSQEKPVENLATPATGQEARPKPGPDRPNRTGTETRFSIPGRTVPARSRQPRSDNHRSRNLRIAREPKRNIPLVQEDPQSKPHT